MYDFFYNPCTRIKVASKTNNTLDYTLNKTPIINEYDQAVVL
jgi:hypothetical protein